MEIHHESLFQYERKYRINVIKIIGFKEGLFGELSVQYRIKKKIGRKPKWMFRPPRRKVRRSIFLPGGDVFS